MAEAAKSERQDGLLWRIARLHPAWMAVPVGLFFCIYTPAFILSQHETGTEAPLSVVIALPSLAFIFIHAFLVTVLVAGRFYARRRRRLMLPGLAITVVIGGPFVLLPAALLAASLGVFQGPGLWLKSIVVPTVGASLVAGYYLMVRASLDLVEAERGFGGGTGRKIGTFLLFAFWVFGAFFIQSRVRRLAFRFASGRGKRLPMEKLEPLEMESGAFALILTESVERLDFDSYADLLVGRLDGHVKRRRDLPLGPCWDIEIEGSDFRLLFDLASKRVILEPEGDSAELLLDRLRTWLAPMAAVDCKVEFPLERLMLEPMASGHLCLELTELPGWWDFELYAGELLRRLEGRVTEKATVVDMHLWNVEIETVPLRLVYEDYPNRICLESDSDQGDTLLRQLHQRLTPPATT